MVTPEDGAFRAIFDTSLDPIIALDGRGCVTDANEAVSHLCATREQAPIG